MRIQNLWPRTYIATSTVAMKSTKMQNPRRPWHLADAHALRQTVSHTYARAPWIARSGKRPTYARAQWIARVSFFACFHAISLERSRFGKIATLISIFSLLTTRWCHSLVAS